MKRYTKNMIIIGIIILFTLTLVYSYMNTNRSAMVIVEPRKHKLLKYVCQNFDNLMPKSWDLYVFHGKSNGSYAEEATREIKNRGRKVFLIPLENDNLNARQYNELFKRLEFWNQVKAEDILVFQTDAVLCGNSKFKIDKFTKFNYIGCSNNNETLWGRDDNRYFSFYGVGGLSFRKNSFQKMCIKAKPNIDPAYAEDVFYSECAEKTSNKPNDISEVRDFCTQSTYFSQSFGAHKISLLNKDQKDNFFDFCPAAKALE